MRRTTLAAGAARAVRRTALAAGASATRPLRAAGTVRWAASAALPVALAAGAAALAMLAATAAPAAAAPPVATAPLHATPFAAHIATATLPVRSAPSPRARQVRLLRQFRRDYRPTVVLAIARHTRAGRPWYRIRLAGRPNGRTGWVAGERLQWLRDEGRISLDLDLSRRRIRVLRGRRTVRSFRVAVGKPGAPTPRGRFYLTAAWRPAEAIYGRWAIETSAGAAITDWPGGGVIGIHGTNQPWLIGQRVSHGCIRMRNADILRLRHWAKPGTRLRIHA
jgi:lipoprotein-anchoring transpeptidase ErfK/SrfK